MAATILFNWNITTLTQVLSSVLIAHEAASKPDPELSEPLEAFVLKRCKMRKASMYAFAAISLTRCVAIFGVGSAPCDSETQSGIKFRIQ